MSQERSEFIGYASHPSLGEEAVRGKLTFVQWRLRFEAEGLVREIPLTRVKIEVESGEEDDQVSFLDPNDPEWRVYTFGTDILAERPFLQQPHTRNQISKFQAAPHFKHQLKLIGVFAAVFVLICIVGSFILSLMVGVLVHRVPPEWEKKLGDDTMKEVKRQVIFVDDTNMMARLERAVAPLLKSLPKDQPPCKFYIIEDPLPNAFAMPGGYVVVHKGLMTLADEPEEIAGVIAHELAHVTQKHGVRLLVTAAGPFFVVKTFFGGGEGFLGTLGASSQLLVQRGFSQEYETEADDVGFQYLVNSHIDPRGLATMLQKLEDHYGNMNVVRPELGPFSSHPDTVKRIERLNARWAKLKDKSGFIKYDETPPGH